MRNTNKDNLGNNLSSKIKTIFIELKDYTFFHRPTDVRQTDKRFIGREKVLERLKAILTKSEAKSGAYLVTGFRGMGKTSVVNKAIADLRGQGWLNLEVRRWSSIFLILIIFAFFNVSGAFNLGIHKVLEFITNLLFGSSFKFLGEASEAITKNNINIVQLIILLFVPFITLIYAQLFFIKASPYFDRKDEKQKFLFHSKYFFSAFFSQGVSPVPQNTFWRLCKGYITASLIHILAIFILFCFYESYPNFQDKYVYSYPFKFQSYIIAFGIVSSYIWLVANKYIKKRPIFFTIIYLILFTFFIFKIILGEEWEIGYWCYSIKEVFQVYPFFIGSLLLIFFIIHIKELKKHRAYLCFFALLIFAFFVNSFYFCEGGLCDFWHKIFKPINFVILSVILILIIRGAVYSFKDRAVFNPKIKNFLNFSHIIHLKINLGQDNLKENEILKLIAKSIYEEYLKIINPLNNSRRFLWQFIWVFSVYMLAIVFYYYRPTYGLVNELRQELMITELFPSQAVFSNSNITYRLDRLVMNQMEEKEHIQGKFNLVDYFEIIYEENDSIEKKNNYMKIMKGAPSLKKNKEVTFAKYYPITMRVDYFIYEVYSDFSHFFIDTFTGAYTTRETDLSSTFNQNNQEENLETSLLSGTLDLDADFHLIPPRLDYFLLLFLIVFFTLANIILRSRLFGVSHKKVLKELKYLIEDIDASVTDEKGGNANIGKFSFFKKRSRTYSVTTAREIETRLIHILALSEEIPAYRMRPKFVFVFDELDKIEPHIEYTPDEKENNNSSLDSYYSEGTKKRQEAIGKILSNLKHFFNTADAKFIFIAGREMYDASLADISDRDSLIGSLFHDIIYVNSFYKDPSDDRLSDVTSMTEQYICQFLIPQDWLEKVSIELEEKYQKNIDLFKEEEDKQKKKDGLIEDKQKKEDKIDSLGNEIVKAKEVVENLETISTKIKTLKKEKTTLEENFQESQYKIDKHHENIKNWNNNTSNLDKTKIEIKEVVKKLEISNPTIKNLKGQFLDNEKELQKIDNKIEEWNKEIENLDNEIFSTTSSITDLENQLEINHTSKQDIENQIQKLSKQHNFLQKIRAISKKWVLNNKLVRVKNNIKNINTKIETIKEIKRIESKSLNKKNKKTSLEIIQETIIEGLKQVIQEEFEEKLKSEENNKRQINNEREKNKTKLKKQEQELVHIVPEISIFGKRSNWDVINRYILNRQTKKKQKRKDKIEEQKQQLDKKIKKAQQKLKKTNEKIQALFPQLSFDKIKIQSDTGKIKIPFKNDLWTYNYYLETEFINEAINDDSARFKVIITLQNFITYLTYRSNGAPKKITKSFEEYIIQIDKKFDSLIDNELVISKNKNSLHLRFGFYDQYVFGLSSYLFNPFLYAVSKYLRDFGDKLLVSTSFLLNHMYKFHNTGFSYRMLELTPEIIAINKAPELRGFIDTLLRFLNNTHIREIISGLHQFKFYSKIEKEISFISRVSEKEAAAYNFTLDESMEIKRIYRKRLAQLHQEHSNNSNFVFSIGYVNLILGDLYYHDQEYDQALIHYQDASLQLRVLPSKDFNLDILVFYLRVELKLGVTFEKKRNYDDALLIYENLRMRVQDFMGILDFNDFQNTYREKEEKYNHLKSDLTPGLRLFYQPLVVTLQTIEKHTVKSLSTKAIEDNVMRFKQLIENRLTIEQFFLMKVEYYDKIGDILFYKNGILSGEKDTARFNKSIKNRFNQPREININEISKPFLPLEPISAYKYYMYSLCSLINFGIDGERSPVRYYKYEAPERSEKVILHYLTYFLFSQRGKTQSIQTRKNFYHAAGNSLSDAADCILGSLYYPNYKTVSDYFTVEKLKKLLTQDLEDKELATSKYWELMKGNKIKCKGFLSFTTDFFDKVEAFYKPFTRFEIAIRYIYMGALMYLKAGEYAEYSFQLRKVLHLVKMIFNIIPEKELTAFTQKQKQELLKVLHKKIAERGIRSIFRSYENNNHAEKKKLEAIFEKYKAPEKKSERISTLIKTSTSASEDIKELLMAFKELELKLGHEMVLNKTTDNVSTLKIIEREAIYYDNNFVHSYSSISSKHSRLLELNYKTHLNYKKYRELNKKNIETVQMYQNTEGGNISIKEAKKFLITDSIFCLYEIVKSLNVYGISYIHNHSWIASAYKRLAYWKKEIEQLHTEIELNEKMEYEKELVRLIGPLEADDLDVISLKERAIQHYYLMLEMHSEGDAYKHTIEKMFYLDDNFNDNLYHFCATLERIQINSGFIQKNIKQLETEVKSRKNSKKIYTVAEYFFNNSK